MTGGQSFDGPLDVSRISRQVHAEGVSQIAVVTDDPDKYAKDADWAPGVLIRHRDYLARVQREMREVEGTTVIICMPWPLERKGMISRPSEASNNQAMVARMVLKGCAVSCKPNPFG